MVGFVLRTILIVAADPQIIDLILLRDVTRENTISVSQPKETVSQDNIMEKLQR